MNQNRQQQQHLDQALHNEKVCDFLHENNQFYDWVVTTAFYSALHYVHYVIFPIEKAIDGKKHIASTIGDYCSLISTKDNKHKVLTDLVYTNCKGIGTAYKALLDMSFLSRYESGCQDNTYSTKARRYLAQVKAHCYTSKAPAANSSQTNAYQESKID